MKNRSVLLGCLFLFIGMCAWAQSGSSDFKMQAIQFAQNDFYNHVTVASNCVYLATIGNGPLDSHKIVQYMGITFRYADGSMSAADKLNGITWKERVYVFSSAFREYRDDRERVWSDWRDGREDCIFLYEIEVKKNSQFNAKGYGLAFDVGFNTEWEMLKPWRLEWGQSGLIPLVQVWARTVRIPIDRIPDDTGNVDLEQLFKSLSVAATKAKGAGSSSENNTSSQTQKNSGTQLSSDDTVRAKLIKNTTQEPYGPKFLQRQCFKTRFEISGITDEKAFYALQSWKRVLQQNGMIRSPGVDYFNDKHLEWYRMEGQQESLKLDVDITQASEGSGIGVTVQVSGRGGQAPSQDQAADEAAAVCDALVAAGGKLQ